MIARRIETRRLVLRPLAEDDLPWVCDACGDYEVSKWLTMVAHPYTPQDGRDFLEMDRAGELGTLWVITCGGAPKGVIYIGKELGYWLSPRAWGQGLMTEAGEAAVAAHFAGTEDAQILSSHFVDNHGSRRVLEKLGFEDIGAHVHFSKARQAEVPGRSMRLTRARWDGLSRAG